MLMSSLSDELTHVLAGFRRPYYCPSKGHQDGRSIHFLLKMSNTHLPITPEQNLAQKCSFKPFTIPQTFWNRNLLFTASEF